MEDWKFGSCTHTPKYGGKEFCKSCYNKAWNKAHVDRVRQAKKDAYHVNPKKFSRRRMLYIMTAVWGLPQEEVDKAIVVWDTFDGVCQACGRDDCSLGVKRRWHMDHDHEAKKFRGMIGCECNLTLGFMKDNPDRLRALAKYLDKFGGN